MEDRQAAGRQAPGLVSQQHTGSRRQAPEEAAYENMRAFFEVAGITKAEALGMIREGRA